MGKINYRELAFKLFCWGFIFVLGLLFFKYLFGYTIPFLIAWGIAYLVYPIANKLSSKIKISRKVCSFLVLLLLLILILSLVYLAVNRLFYEIKNLLQYLTDNGEAIAVQFKNLFDSLFTVGQKLPIINKLQDEELVKEITENVNLFIEGVWKKLIDALSSAVPNFATGIVMALPNIVLVSLVTVIACFYFAIDIEAVNSKILSFLPEGTRTFLQKLKKKVGFGLKRYLRAYLILFLITFAELFVGFLILGVDYSFVLAILIAFVDFLPVFGTPAVLLPWGIVLLFMKEYFVGVGMLVLASIIMIVRQVIEPKILGKNLGVHPLVTLITLYVGFELFGIFGMVFLPIVVLILFSKGEEKGGGF
ncbi:MAG: sporulation integral membrane protein YtvI [Clostridia bacterium]|nr:sporulation integral membrane protein YtvI [Clostridia bacterium]